MDYYKVMKMEKLQEMGVLRQEMWFTDFRTVVETGYFFLKVVAVSIEGT